MGAGPARAPLFQRDLLQAPAARRPAPTYRQCVERLSSGGLLVLVASHQTTLPVPLRNISFIVVFSVNGAWHHVPIGAWSHVPGRALSRALPLSSFQFRTWALKHSSMRSAKSCPAASMTTMSLLPPWSSATSSSSRTARFWIRHWMVAARHIQSLQPLAAYSPTGSWICNNYVLISPSPAGATRDLTLRLSRSFPPV